MPCKWSLGRTQHPGAHLWGGRRRPDGSRGLAFALAFAADHQQAGCWRIRLSCLPRATAVPGYADAHSKAGGEPAGCIDARESAMHERISGSSACCCRPGSVLPHNQLACLRRDRIDGLERGVFANVLMLMWVY